MYGCTGSKSPNSLLSVEVIAAIVITLISIILTCIVVIIVVKKCFLKKKQTPQRPVIQMSTINNIITSDINFNSSPADVDTKSKTTGTSIKNDPDIKNNQDIKNDSADVKMKSNPAYHHIIQKDRLCRDKNDYYYY